MNDITDHLPEFIVYDCNYKKVDQTIKSQYRWVWTDDSLKALKFQQMTYDWVVIYRIDDVDVAYEECLRIFILLYNQNCPVKEYKRKRSHKNQEWVTKGLQNACKKKNLLFKEFIKLKK